MQSHVHVLVLPQSVRYDVAKMLQNINRENVKTIEGIQGLKKAGDIESLLHS